MTDLCGLSMSVSVSVCSERQLRDQRKDVAKAKKQLLKLTENAEKLKKASQSSTKKTSKAQAQKVKTKLAKLEQAEQLQSSLVSDEHTVLCEEMTRLRCERVHASFLNFSCVCPEPVWVKCSHLL
jgi:hypothetical protein|eukprot:COSAG06_NODE_4161_length_4506_cov_5.576740_2_plen_125_part_00